MRMGGRKIHLQDIAIRHRERVSSGGDATAPLRPSNHRSCGSRQVAVLPGRTHLAPGVSEAHS